jgi:hypothetical protein
MEVRARAARWSGGHCMRKALSIIWDVWRNGTDFDPAWAEASDLL